MNPIPSVQQKKRGSALLTVVMLTAMMAILTASMLSYTLGEKRGNERNRVQLRAKNMAENISVYAAEQLTTKLYRTRATTAMAFMTGSDEVKLPDDTGNANVLSTVNYATVSGMEVRAGMLAPTPYTLITDPSDGNFGLQVSTATVPIIAKATVTHPALGPVTAHVLQEMEIAMTPLFQFGMFYNMDMELYPSQAFTVAGPVHTNGRLIAHADGSANIDLRFTDRVTAVEGIYWYTALKAMPRNGAGGQNPPNESSGNVYFTHTNGTTTANLKGTSGTMSGKWKDHRYGQATENATTLNNFKTNATATWNGNVRTNQHGVTALKLPGVGTYKETDDPNTPEDDRNNGRAIIEPPNARHWRASDSTWPVTVDNADAKESKISWKAGLYIMVNPDGSPTPRSGTLPDGSTAYVLPRSYRAWLNSLVGTTRTCTEVVLPGQPTYGYNPGADGILGNTDDYMYRNLLPNRYESTTVAGDGTGNQVLRIPQQDLSNASGYLINNLGGYIIGATTLAVDTGTGPILPGQSLTIGAHQYLVTTPLNGGNVTIAAPGLRTLIADNTPVTVNNPDYGTGNAYQINAALGHAVGTTYLNVDTGSGTILPGNTVTISGRKYVVASALVGGTFTIVSPGIRVATATDNTAVALDNLEGMLASGSGYQVNNGAGYATGTTTLTVDTGTGSILPGNYIAIGADRYLVTNATAGSPVTSITIANPGLLTAVTDDTPVLFDPFLFSGYSTDVEAPSGAISSGRAYPADNLAAPYSYFPADAYFFDMRRANGNRGVRGLSGTTALYDRFTVNYVPRPIAKIDFDLARFKMMVNRVMSAATTLSMYDLRAPNVAGVTFNNSIYKAVAAEANFGLGMGAAFNVFPANTDNTTRMRQDPFNLYYAPTTPEAAATIDRITGNGGNPNPLAYLVPASDLYDGTAPDAWFDGIAVYLHSVDAEKRAQTAGVPDRVDSGVRMWNGRGNVVSLSTVGKTGFTFVTNDALYVIGHFNADGTINSTVTSTTNPGGYSAAYPDNATEKLCALMGDSIVIGPQPIWATAAGGQTQGWNDALTALAHNTSSANWRTGTSSTSTLNGSYDGVITGANGPRAGLLPNRSYPGTLGVANSIKLPAIDTEVSAALLCGLVPSNADATGLSDNPPMVGANGVQSGGANNFPRMLDNWSGDGLYIRGSIVGLFESRVFMEPFTNARCYNAPGRYWGLHNDFRTANHDVPLEPIVIGCARKRYREMTPAEYATQKTVIEALPH